MESFAMLQIVQLNQHKLIFNIKNETLKALDHSYSSDFSFIHLDPILFYS